MRLSNEEFKKMKELEKKTNLSSKEKELFEALKAKKAAPEESQDPGNDPTWWKKVPSLLKDSCNLKSNWIAGTQLGDLDFPFIPAGVVKYTIEATFGNNAKATDPLNVWARDLYLRMFQRWRGITAYTAADLGITCLAGVEVVRTIAKLERIYGVINRYSKRNINMPFVEQEALGLTQSECDWIRNHLSDFRYDLNVLIRKAQRLCIPKDMSIILDSVSLLGFEYLDHDNDKAQIIIFDTESFGVYSDTYLTTGGCIKYETIGGAYPLIDTTGNSDNMFVVLETQLNALLGSDGVQKIYGDLVTWFGDEQLLPFKELVDDYIIAPAFSESILHKMHNMNVINGGLYSVADHQLPSADISLIYTDKCRLVYQVNDCIITKFGYITGMSSPSWENMGDFDFLAYPNGSTFALTPTDGCDILDTYRKDVNEDIIVEGCLFKHTLSIVQNSTPSYGCELRNVGFWVVSSIKVIKLYNNGSIAATVVDTNYSISANAQSAAGLLAILDWAPLTFVVTIGLRTEEYGDIDTPIPIYANTLKRILQAVEYSGLQTDIVVRAEHK